MLQRGEVGCDVGSNSREEREVGYVEMKRMMDRRGDEVAADSRE